jgi:hypothetical protein
MDLTRAHNISGCCNGRGAISLKTHTKIWAGHHNREIVTLRRRRYVLARRYAAIRRWVISIHHGDDAMHTVAKSRFTFVSESR